MAFGEEVRLPPPWSPECSRILLFQVLAALKDIAAWATCPPHVSTGVHRCRQVDRWRPQPRPHQS
eukprot:2183173-Pyramimonas_sp.AAC.1